MTKYAQNTKVSVAKSRAEIERSLQRYGAEQFISGWDEATSVAMIGFSIRVKDQPRQVRLQLDLPSKAKFKRTKNGRPRKREQVEIAWEKECRRLWRSLALVVKAKLEAVESGISTVEREFLADVVMPDGSTVGDWAAPQIAAIYQTGKMPPLLPGVTADDDDA